MDHSSAITQVATDLLDHLGFADTVSVKSHHDPESNSYQVLLETADPGLLIGYHGETLSAFQHLLSLHLHHDLSDWINLTVNVNDYRQRRESSVFALADSVAHKVIATGKPHPLPPMPALERRLVHLRLADHPQVVTSSEGSGRTRSVIVSPK